MTSTRAIIQEITPITLRSPMAIPMPIMHEAAAKAKNNNGHFICFKVVPPFDIWLQIIIYLIVH